MSAFKTNFTDCYNRGQEFEQTAMGILRENGYSVENATLDENKYQKIDFWAVGKDAKRYSFDAKAMRSLVRGGPLQDEWVVVEWKNVIGLPGSIYGKQDFFVFERMNTILIVRRTGLLEFAKSRVDFTKIANRSDAAFYGVYTRHGRSDLISQINLNDLPTTFTRAFPRSQPNIS